VRTQDEIKRNMLREVPDSDSGLASLYIFDGASVRQEGSDAGIFAMDRWWAQAGPGAAAVPATVLGAGLQALLAWCPLRWHVPGPRSR
jgi:hypothetical protein